MNRSLLRNDPEQHLSPSRGALRQRPVGLHDARRANLRYTGRENR
jgi:hypothetical protein